MQSKPLIEECSEALRGGEIARSPGRVMVSYHDLDTWLKEEYDRAASDVLDVLRRRGLINEQGLEIIKREME